jgi:hypothetical protein
MFFNSNRLSLTAVTALSLFPLSLFSVACSGAPSSETTASSSSQAVSVDPAFTPCAVDSDCVAVPQAGCCQNGWLAAVNADLVCAYQDANVCTTPQPICPQYIVNDTRVALCDNSANACAMVAPTSIQCGGEGSNPHACPAGFDCVQSNNGPTSLCAPHVAPANDAGAPTLN